MMGRELVKIVLSKAVVMVMMGKGRIWSLNVEGAFEGLEVGTFTKMPWMCWPDPFVPITHFGG